MAGDGAGDGDVTGILNALSGRVDPVVELDVDQLAEDDVRQVPAGHGRRGTAALIR